MGLEFLDRVRKTSIAAGIVVALIVSAHRGPAAGAAFAAGCAWTLVNLHVLRLLVREAIGDRSRHGLRIAAILVIKVPVLYVAGYLALKTAWMPVVWLLVGSAWPLAVIALKAAGRAMLHLDNPRPRLRAAGTGDTDKGD